MKNHPLLNRKARIAFFVLLIAFDSFAQPPGASGTLIPPVLSETPIGGVGIGNPAVTVNCDMLEYVSSDGTQATLKAVVWDETDH